MDTRSLNFVLQGGTSTRIMLAGLTLGVAGDIIFWGGTLKGPGLSIWLLLLGAAGVIINIDGNRAWRIVLALWSSVALLASLLVVLRASMSLLPLVILVIAMCGVAVLMQASVCSLGAARLRDYMRAGWKFPLRVLPGFFPLLLRLQRQGLTRSSRVLGLIKGALLSLPLLLVFVGLFSSADANFDRYVTQIVDTIDFAAPQHLLAILLIGCLATGLLRCTQSQRASPESCGQRLVLGGEETAMIMGSLVLLFVSFVVLQASYLFAGQAMIEASTGLTVADYARRGFFELITVASLTLAVLLALRATQCSQRIFRPLACVLIACVLLILASAAQRLCLYINSFGLSLSRVFAAALMVWLAGNLLGFAFTSLRGRERGFASGLVLSGILTIFLVVLANPSAVVARVNLDRALRADVETDWQYLLNLGADAVPTILSSFAHLPRQVQCQMANELLLRYGDDQEHNSRDWRSWNYGEARARSEVTQAYAELSTLSGQEQVLKSLGSR